MFPDKITKRCNKVYYNLLDDYRKFERIAKSYTEESSLLDLSNERFIAPTTMIPLLCFYVQKNIERFIVNQNTEE